MLAQVFVAAFVLGHALIHASFLAPRPPATAGGPPWPFELGRSAVLAAVGLDVNGAVSRGLGMALVAVTVGGFALAALSALRVVPEAMWMTGVVVGAVASLATLVLFFHPWLVLGIAIDVALLWAVLVAHWTPKALAA